MDVIYENEYQLLFNVKDPIQVTNLDFRMAGYILEIAEKKYKY